MNVELKDSGCNIIASANSFYNYSSDSKTRETFFIYEGKAFLQSSTYNQYGYSYSGTCLHTGDLVYKPELPILFSLYSFLVILVVAVLIYKVILKRLLP